MNQSLIESAAGEIVDDGPLGDEHKQDDWSDHRHAHRLPHGKYPANISVIATLNTP
jgi:hypothetical protein